MATNDESGIICLVNGLPRYKKQDWENCCSAVLYFEKENLATFSPLNFPPKSPQRFETEKTGWTRPWEGRVWDATFKSPSELHFVITIFPEGGRSKLVGGAAYVKDDPMNSAPKVFHIYPGKQDDDANPRLPFYKDEEFEYLCVYYGTRVDQTIPALMGKDHNIPEVVPWQHYASLGEQVAMLEKENRELISGTANSKQEIERLERENRELTSGATNAKQEIERLEKENRELVSGAANARQEIERLERENRELVSGATESKKEIDRLKALAKAVVDAIEGLKNYDKNDTSSVDKNGTSAIDKNGTSTADKGEISTTDGGNSSAA